MNNNTLKKIYKIFAELAEINYKNKEPFKRAAYLKAIRVIKVLEQNGETDLLLDPDVKIPGLGTKLRAKIFEINNTGKLKSLEETNVERKSKQKTAFDGIRGFSEAFINKLLDRGINTIAKLRKAKVRLTEQQDTGLLFHEDLNKKIPRNEITKIIKIMRKYLEPGYELFVGGSYSRGKKESGDIDVILYKKGSTKLDDYFGHYIRTLQFSNEFNIMGVFLDGKTRVSYVFETSLSPIAHQIDMMYVPESDLPTAMMHSIGSGQFNQEIRTIAKKKGYKLSEKGLFKGDRKIKIKNEKDIFRILNIPYVPPNLRNG